MISGLVGILIAVESSALQIQVSGGLIYEVLWGKGTVELELGSQIHVFTHLIVREDAWQLYGFLQKEEVSFFKELLRVSGVGPKLAQTVVGLITPEDFAQLILQKDHARLSKFPGIGKKTAERLVMELKDRFLAFGLMDAPLAVKKNSRSPAVSGDKQDALAALRALGYSQEESLWALSQVVGNPDSTDAWLKEALKQFMTRGSLA